MKVTKLPSLALSRRDRDRQLQTDRDRQLQRDRDRQ